MKDSRKQYRAFTLIELLVVVGIIGVVAALLFAGLSRAKSAAQTTSCKNHLHQIGLSMQMYVSEHSIYPSAMGGGPPFKTWPDRLAPYNSLNWTNVAWHCPTYIAEGGIVKWKPPPPDGGKMEISSSYAYNAFGMSGFRISETNLSQKGQWLGLGDLNLTVRESRIAAPSEMFAVGDTRPFQFQDGHEFVGRVEMIPWLSFLPSFTSSLPKRNLPMQGLTTCSLRTAM